MHLKQFTRTAAGPVDWRRALGLAGRWQLLAALVLCGPAAGCWRASGPEVVVYTALDSEFSQPVLSEFSAASGVNALPKFDIESTKTLGLVEAIIAEQKRPRCDVFWNNEILHTLRLEKLGLLEPYPSPAGAPFPAMYRSPQGLWHGFAARARILIVNTDKLPADRRPHSILALAEPQWRGQVGLAKPLFGTTATHAACLFAAWGDQRAREFFDQLKPNVKIMGGNKQVAEAVAAGQLAFGLTDTDDAMIEVEKGMPVEIVYPDQEAGGLGTLFIPNTLSIIKDARNPAAARRLVDYLLSPAVEAQLADGPSAQIPLNPQVKTKARIETPATLRAMQVDFESAGDKWPDVAGYLRDRFTTE
jgi:iron(III) transport system substrate-binding protein